jgi:hypothetical protein
MLRRLGVILLLVLPAGASAQDAPATAPARPLLEQLDRETKALHREVQRGVLRVQLPPPRWLDEVAGHEADNPLTKYKELDPRVREQLEQRRRRSAAEGAPLASAGEAGPSTQAVSDADWHIGDTAAVIVVPPPQPAVREAQQAAPSAPGVTSPAFSPNNVGLLLDEQGHLLVPLYLEREAAAKESIRVSSPGGKVTDARFVGSDRQTNLTVLRMIEPAGEPVRLGVEDRPVEGSLVLLVTPHDGSGRLSLWTGNGRDYAAVFSIDGQCAGVARFGQFLSGRACRLIAEQIIRHGSVKRATLGVMITQVARDDATGQQSPLVGGRAMRVDQVIAGSPADAAGIRVGDIVLALAGQAASDIPSLAAAIAARSGPTEVRLLRGGQVITVTVDLQQK